MCMLPFYYLLQVSHEDKHSCCQDNYGNETFPTFPQSERPARLLKLVAV